MSIDVSASLFRRNCSSKYRNDNNIITEFQEQKLLVLPLTDDVLPVLEQKTLTSCTKVSNSLAQLHDKIYETINTKNLAPLKHYCSVSTVDRDIFEDKTFYLLKCVV